jgi:pimeloyl-ACP methyl ester carboxylesterase
LFGFVFIPSPSRFSSYTRTRHRHATNSIDRFALIGWSYGAFACYAYLEHAGFGRVEHLAILDQRPRPFACEHEKTWCEGDWSFFNSNSLCRLDQTGQPSPTTSSAG